MERTTAPDPTPLIRSAARALWGDETSTDAVPPLVRFLREGDLTVEGRRELASTLGGHGIRNYELGILMSLALHLLAGEEVGGDGLRAWSYLKAVFEVREGEFLQYVPVETATFLQSQLDLVLEDSIIDPVEDENQAALQDAFDLSYDEYLALTRKCWEAAAARLQDALRTEHRPEERAAAQEQLERLEPLIRLATMHQRRLGALY